MKEIGGMFDLTFSRMRNVSFGGEGKGSFNSYERRVEDEDSIEILGKFLSISCPFDLSILI